MAGEGEKIKLGESLNERILKLHEAIQARSEKHIDFEKLYSGAALRAVSLYGLDVIVRGYQRLAKFVGEFENRFASNETDLLTKGEVERVEEALAVIEGAKRGEALGILDGRAAYVVAQELEERIQVLKEKGILDNNFEGNIKVAGEYPLAQTMRNVEMMERLLEEISMDFASKRLNSKDSEERFKQIQIQEKKKR